MQKLPESTTTSASKDYMTGVGMLDNRLIILLDVDKVLTSAELIELGAISEMTDKVKKTPEKPETTPDNGGKAPKKTRKTRKKSGSIED